MKVGIIGYGRIGAYLYEKFRRDPHVTVSWVYEKIVEKTRTLDKALLVDDPEQLKARKTDLVVEAADFTAIASLAPLVLKHSNMLILSASALADDALDKMLRSLADENGNRIYVPHGALLGMDGFQDGRDTFDEIVITTVKAPKNLDFTFQTKWNLDDIKSRTVLHDGTT